MMKALVLAAAAAATACGGGGDDDAPGDDAGPGYLACTGTDQAFVRQATLAVLGRRPRSQAEVNVYADLMAGVRALAEADPDAGATATPPDPREVAIRALLEEDGYVDRWSEHVMDALRVPRIEDQSQAGCYGVSTRGAGVDDGHLAAHVRDTAPTDGGDGDGPFSMLDLLRSALVLDDLSVVYRAHLFALVSRPIPAANVPPVEAELARREDFGVVFDATYLNRDLVCLGCHNSEGSVTFDDDPLVNRHWAMPGLFEAAIYGESTGIAVERAHAAFRYDGFVATSIEGEGTIAPWEWHDGCGRFSPTGLEPDPAGVDGRLASLTGDTLTVFDLDAALARGFETLAEDELVIDDDGTIADPDAAMAYLVAATMVEGVWREVIGTPLTIANYFPRNRAARDVLVELTVEFVRNRFSLRELLVDIALQPYFNRPPPEAGCGASAYDMPPIYDPWVTTDPDESRRQNGAGDAVVALSPRVLLRAAYDALEWRLPYAYAFPQDTPAANFCIDLYTCRQMEGLCDEDGTCCEAYRMACVDPPGPNEPDASAMRALERGIGIFLKHGERGFRGLDFQARLVFEDLLGGCVNPDDDADFVAELLSRAGDEGATVGDVVAALKDRLVGEARVAHEAPDGAPVSELEAVESIMGPLDAAAGDVEDLDDRTRALCGVLLSSPQFLLTGIGVPDSRYVPVLTATDQAAVCEAVAARDLLGGLTASCDGGAITVAAP